MKIDLKGDVAVVRSGFDELAKERLYEICAGGYTVEAVRRPGPLEIRRSGSGPILSYDAPGSFFRGLALILADPDAPLRTESMRVKRAGVSLDVSRNAAPTVDTIKRIIRTCALMGYGFIMLYMEDMYPVPGARKFGYMRGRYTAEELRAVDDYAAMFGIEVIPYIQTLAHLSQVLKWDEMRALRDTDDILLAGSDETYALIDRMLGSLAGIFRSRRINLGMDEAHDLGLGRYRDLHGMRSGREILAEHLGRVSQIAEKHGLRGIIASDMLFGAQDAPIRVPENIDLMYWDYDRTDPQEIAARMEAHRAWGGIPMYLGTVRTWESFSTAYADSFKNLRACVEACARVGADEAAISVWMNDGAENSLLASIPGLAFFAGQVYAPDMDPAVFRRLFRVQTGADYDAFLLLGEIDALQAEGVPARSNASKVLLWQDVLLGLFDAHVAHTDAAAHYAALASRLEAVPDKFGPYRPLCDMMCALCRVLAVKADLGVRLTRACLDGDTAALRQMADDVLPGLEARTEALRVSCMMLWMQTLKPFGFEILDGRFGALQARLRTARMRIDDLLSGRIAHIEELEAERQPFAGRQEDMPTVLTYDRIFSVGTQNGPTR